jgi:hypothetical protein
MKNIALVAALVLATTTASIRVAAACGGYGQEPPRIGATLGSKALGIWPRLHRDGARTILTLSYPRFGNEGPDLYMDQFEVVRDRNLRRLERVIAARRHPDLDVTIERVDGTSWRVVGWKSRA